MSWLHTIFGQIKIPNNSGQTALGIQPNVSYIQGSANRTVVPQSRTTKAITTIDDQLHSLRWSIITLVILIILSSLPLSALIVGGIRRFDCPKAPGIPIWLIVFGAVGLGGCSLTALLVILRSTCLYEQKEQIVKVLILLIGIIVLFFGIWGGVGLSWTTSIGNYQSSNSSTSDYCNDTVYKLTLALAIIIIMPLFILTCGVSCFYCCKSKCAFLFN